MADLFALSLYAWSLIGAISIGYAVVRFSYPEIRQSETEEKLGASAVAGFLIVGLAFVADFVLQTNAFLSGKGNAFFYSFVLLSASVVVLRLKFVTGSQKFLTVGIPVHIQRDAEKTIVDQRRATPPWMKDYGEAGKGQPPTQAMEPDSEVIVLELPMKKQFEEKGTDASQTNAGTAAAGPTTETGKTAELNGNDAGRQAPHPVPETRQGKADYDAPAKGHALEGKQQQKTRQASEASAHPPATELPPWVSGFEKLKRDSNLTPEEATDKAQALLDRLREKTVATDSSQLEEKDYGEMPEADPAVREKLAKAKEVLGNVNEDGEDKELVSLERMASKAKAEMDSTVGKEEAPKKPSGPAQPAEDPESEAEAMMRDLKLVAEREEATGKIVHRRYLLRRKGEEPSSVSVFAQEKAASTENFDAIIADVYSQLKETKTQEGPLKQAVSVNAPTFRGRARRQPTRQQPNAQSPAQAKEAEPEKISFEDLVPADAQGGKVGQDGVEGDKPSALFSQLQGIAGGGDREIRFVKMQAEQGMGCPTCKTKNIRVIFCPFCGTGLCANCSPKVMPGAESIKYQCPNCCEQVEVTKSNAKAMK